MQKRINDLENDLSNQEYGMFYVNKLDKRIMVPKKHYGQGMTFNFGNSKSFLYLALIVIAITFFIGFTYFIQFE